ncbi:MAG: START domain-containing protein [Polyangiaceae bacterium]
MNTRLDLLIFACAAVACGGTTRAPAHGGGAARPNTALSATHPGAADGAMGAQAGCRDWALDDAGGVRWELDDDEDGIRNFVGKVPNSDFVAFRGVGAIDAPIAKVAMVLIDTSKHDQWVPHFGGMRVVRHVSKTEKIIYRHVTTPPIISDRDFVAKVGIRKDAVAGHLMVEFRSVVDPLAPEIEGRVRGTLHTSGYRMWPIDGGARTMVVFTIHADPKGSVPAWIVNLFQGGYARKNINNIRRRTTKADVEEHPEIKKSFAAYKTICKSDQLVR